MKAGALIPETRNPQSLGPSKVGEKEAILTAGISSCAMGTNRCLIASLITSRYRVRVSQNNAVCKFGIENFFTLSLQTLEGANRAIRDMGHKHTSVSLPLHAYQLKQPLLLKGWVRWRWLSLPLEDDDHRSGPTSSRCNHPLWCCCCQVLSLPSSTPSPTISICK